MLLEFKNAGLSLGGKQLFNDVSLTLREGEMLGVSGASGQGKTSLLRVILGFLPLDKGYVSIDGEPVTALSAGTFRRQMAYIPQEVSLPEEHVRDMAEMPFLLKVNQDIPYTKSRLMREWHKLNLEPELYDRRVSEISGGQRQRILIAVAGLLAKPVLLVDEPTSALDEDNTLAVAEYLKEMARHGTMIVCVSHDAGIINRCDKVLHL